MSEIPMPPVVSSFETLTLERPAPHVLLVTLDRQEARNALNTRMGLDLMTLFEQFQVTAGDTRAIVLTGRGDKAFCAGGDLKERRSMSDETWTVQHKIFERMSRAIHASPLPVIAAVNGAAYGGGCEIAAACDFIYAAASARFALTEVTLGIMPGIGGTQHVARAIGARRAKELLLTGTPFGAEEGERWGLVNRVCADDALVSEALATAGRIAANAPIAVRQIKQSVSRGLDMSVWDGLAFEIEAYNRMVPTEDRHEGVNAFNEKRPPQFKGR
ncbi:enoyl-CoA hydratase/isomerase family protein [Acuticoccus kandeliae]|uniref:enoyl-CoA hydratase/isomerase family protein n=1 Tax=Acuticoccus kandeliae TaxID=2073160 RepID=UPI000D3ED83B|nr:enoyl-CoA hydratase-related protein [Acuticoccus kandeliae]